MRTAVITTVAGRFDHLERQHTGLASSTVSPDLYVVVSMDDPASAGWHPAEEPLPRIETIGVVGAALPLASARNRGAERAIREGAEFLVFLDVDCIPEPTMLEGYIATARANPDALLSGAVGYLPEGTDYTRPTRFGATARFHDFRGRLAAGEAAAAEPHLFWSLSFAISSAGWRTIGGFCEDYVGYGGEDTDFGMRARRAGVESLWVGGAEAFHQYHPTKSPPIDHLDDILINGSRFRERWGWWPMQGWLEQFESLGLIERDEAKGWQRVGGRS